MAATLVLLLLTTALAPLLRRLEGREPAARPSRWNGTRAGSLEHLTGAVVEATARIERLDVPDDARAECRRLRELARSLQG